MPTTSITSACQLQIYIAKNFHFIWCIEKKKKGVKKSKNINIWEITSLRSGAPQTVPQTEPLEMERKLLGL